MALAVQLRVVVAETGYDGQLYLDEPSRLSADLAHLRSVWAAEIGAEIRAALAVRDSWLVQTVLAYDSVQATCFACLLGHECKWHSKEDADALDA